MTRDTNDAEIAGTLHLRLGEALLKASRLALALSGPGTKRTAVIERLKGNHLRFAFSPKGLGPGDYTLSIIVREGDNSLGSTTVDFTVVKPPFDF